MKNVGSILALACALSACGPAGEEPTGTTQSALRNATPEDALRGVVYIGRVGCSGTLIAPNLVLTGQHCVAPLNQNGHPTCGLAFGKVRSAGSFFVSTRSPAGAEGHHAVSEVRVMPAEAGTTVQICGNDRALLVLAEPIPSSEATPIAPRLDRAAELGESLTIVGFGVTGDETTSVEEPTRRRLDIAKVSCLAPACARKDVAAGEWIAEAEVCEGDSGGAILDKQGQLLGVISRGNKKPCGSNVVAEDVHAARTWLSSVATEASEKGGYPVPSWVPGSSPTTDHTDTDAEPSAGAEPAPLPSTKTDSGCALVPSARKSDSAFLVIAVLAAVLRGRRYGRSSRPL